MSNAAPRKLRVILNPNAGQKAGIPTAHASEADVRALMRNYGLGDELIVSTCEEDAIAATRDAVAERYDVVAGVGGDGTVGCIAKELIGTETALGIIPGGSVMNIARMLELPRDMGEAAAAIARGATKRIDIGEANGQVFFEVASVGVNAPVFQAAQHFDAGEYGSIMRAIWVAIRYRPARMTIRLDDETVVTRALMVTVANGSYTGMGFTVAPSAEVDDGRFDVSLFRRFSRTGLLLHFAKIAFGRTSYSPKVVTFRSREVHITSAHPLPCRADANDLGNTPATFICHPSALTVIVPEPQIEPQ